MYGPLLLFVSILVCVCVCVKLVDRGRGAVSGLSCGACERRAVSGWMTLKTLNDVFGCLLGYLPGWLLVALLLCCLCRPCAVGRD